MIRRVSNGFTLVELLIVIAIMGILLVLGVVNLRGTQATARDSQRASDAQTIATSLEAFWPIGNAAVVAGEYPSTNLVTDLANSTATPKQSSYLIDINPKAFIAPAQSTESLVAATNAVQTTAGVLPQPTISQYVYQPIASDGTLCITDAQGCRKYYIYYQTEVDSVVHQITSRHQ